MGDFMFFFRQQNRGEIQLIYNLHMLMYTIPSTAWPRQPNQFYMHASFHATSCKQTQLSVRINVETHPTMKIAVKNLWKQKIRYLHDGNYFNGNGGEMELDDLQDVIFKVTDENGKVSHLKCHKFILAMASPVFKSQFFGPLKAKR